MAFKRSGVRFPSAPPLLSTGYDCLEYALLCTGSNLFSILACWLPPPLACTSKIARLYFRHLKRFLSTGYKYHRRCSAEEAVRGNPEFKLETAQRKNIAHFRLWPIADI